MGIQLSDKRPFAKYFHNSNSLLTEKNAVDTNGTVFLAFLSVFIALYLKNDYVGLWLYELSLATHSILNTQ